MDWGQVTMLYKFLRRFKNVICFVVMICIMIPLLSACGDLDNGLKKHRENSKIGVGNNIEAYTTYREAPFKKMTQDLYYSYLMNYRPFILVVVPDSSVTFDENGNVSSLNGNWMLEAASSGVFQYNETYSQYSENELKVLMYYVIQSDFNAWEDNAVKEDGFVRKAFDFVKGGTAASKPSDAEYNPRHFKCHKIVHMGSSLANPKGNEMACARSGDMSNSIFNVGDGIVLLYGEGSLEGYIRHGDIAAVSDSYENYFKKLIPEQYYVNIQNSIREIDSSNVSKEVYKMAFDTAILSRISKLNKNTRFDFSKNDADFNNTQGLMNKIDLATTSEADMNNALKGEGKFKDKSYIALVTANGFIFDRGDIVAESVSAMFSEEYALILEELMRMDACPNETLAKKIADILSTGAIFAGGAILVTTLFVAPFPGARIIGAALLLAGLIYKAATKGAAATSVSYCEVYLDTLKEIKKSSIMSVPIFTYNIGRDPKGSTVYLCVKQSQNASSCEQKVDLYYNANFEVADKMSLDGMPYIGFYHEGELVDYIYGASDPVFITEILSSWGVMITADTKYFASADNNGNINIVDRGRTNNVRNSIQYCYSFEYGASVGSSNCINGVKNFANTSYVFNESNSFTYESTFTAEDFSSQARNNVSDILEKNRIDFNGFINRVKEANALNNVHDILNELNSEVQVKATVNRETILSMINNAKNIADGILQVRYLEDPNGNKYFINELYNEYTLLDGNKYKFDFNNTTLVEINSNTVYEFTGGSTTIGGYTYNLKNSETSVEIAREAVALYLEKELKDMQYFVVKVPVYMSIVVKETMPGLTEEDKQKYRWDENGNECKDIRINKIWGHKKCYTDLKWYHIKDNWVKPSATSVTTEMSTDYTEYDVELKFGS